MGEQGLTLEEQGRALVNALSGLVRETANLVDGGQEVVEWEPELPRRGRVLAFEVGQEELAHANVLPSRGKRAGSQQAATPDDVKVTGKARADSPFRISGGSRRPPCAT